MNAQFSVMEQHLEAPRTAAAGGKLVLSRLKPGHSVIGSRAPSVKLVLDGEEVYQVDGRTLRVQPGQFLYLDAGTDCIGSNRVETTGLCLMLPIVDGHHGRGDGPAEGVLGRALALSTHTSNMGEALLSYGRAIARNPELGDVLAPEIIDRVGAALGEPLAPEIIDRVGTALGEPLAQSRAAIDSLKAAKPSTRRNLYQRLERARAHLHDHIDRNVALAELGTVAGLSQFHLARYFKLAFGEAPIAYHRRLRLGRAAELLAAGAGSVAEAAEAAGYSDATALSHAFRKQYGRAPQQWAMDAGR